MTQRETDLHSVRRPIDSANGLSTGGSPGIPAQGFPFVLHSTTTGRYPPQHSIPAVLQLTKWIDYSQLVVAPHLALHFHLVATIQWVHVFASQRDTSALSCPCY